MAISVRHICLITHVAHSTDQWLTPIVVAVVAIVAVCVPKSEKKSSPTTRQTNIRPDTDSDSDSDSQMLR